MRLPVSSATRPCLNKRTCEHASPLRSRQAAQTRPSSAGAPAPGDLNAACSRSSTRGRASGRGRAQPGRRASVVVGAPALGRPLAGRGGAGRRARGRVQQAGAVGAGDCVQLPPHVLGKAQPAQVQAQLAAPVRRPARALPRLATELASRLWAASLLGWQLQLPDAVDARLLYWHLWWRGPPVP